MDFSPLISIPIIYFAVAFIKPGIQPKLPFNLCSICVSVSLTWVILLFLWLLGYSISPLTLGILMGMSVTGVMYKAEALYAKQKIRNFWLVRLVIIVGGFSGVWNFLNEQWNVFTLVAIGSLLVIAIATFFFQGITHADAVRGAGGKSSIVRKLDDCC